VRRQEPGNGRQFAGKAQRQQPVGLVEDDMVDCGEVEDFVIEQVEQAAGGGDQQVAALAQGLDLFSQRHAAVNRDAGQIKVAGVSLAGGCHLLGQFSGRDQDQRRALVLAGQALQQWQGEGGGLAAAGGGGRQQVAAGEDGRERLLLNRRRLAVAQFVQGLLQRGEKVKGGEAHAGRRGQ